MTPKFISLVLLFILISTSFISCKKEKDDVDEPRDLAASASGSYDMSYLRLKTNTNDINTNLPLNSDDGRITGVVDVDEEGENVVSVIMTLMQDGQELGKIPIGGKDVELKEENSAIALYLGTDKIGTINDDDLNISITGGEGELIIRAQK